MNQPDPGTGQVNRPRILAFAGSNRADSVNRRLAEAAAAALRDGGLEVSFKDLRNYPMPLYDGDEEAGGGTPAAVLEFQQQVREHAALVIASPEYNGSFSALIKNTLDWISRPAAGDPPLAAFQGKKAAILSAAPGRGGGQRGLKHLRELLEMIGVQVVRSQVSVPMANEAFGPDGRLVRPGDLAAMESLVSDLRTAFH